MSDRGDCTEQDGAYRDLLPELAAEGGGSASMPVADHARVVAHLAGCAACQAELELLRAARRAAIAATPAVDVARIVRALPHPPRAEASPAVRPVRRRGWSAWPGWSVAAAISTIAVAGLSVVVLRDGSRGSGTPPAVAVRPTAPSPTPTVGGTSPLGPVPPSTRPAAPPSGQASHAPTVAAPEGGGGGGGGGAVGRQPGGEGEAAGLEVSGGLSGLDETQLQALLQDIDNLEAEPVGEPEAAAPALRAAAEGA